MRPAILLYDWDNTLVDGWAGITAALNAVFDAFAMPHWSVGRHPRARPRLAARQFPGDVRRRVGARARHLLRHAGGAAPAPCAGRCPARPRRWRPARRGRRAWCPTRPDDSCAPRWRISAGRGISARWSAPATRRPTSRIPAPILLALDRLGGAADRSVWYLGDTALDMAAARAAGVTAVLVGDASHDGGIDRARSRSPFPYRARPCRTASCACVSRVTARLTMPRWPCHARPGLNKNNSTDKKKDNHRGQLRRRRTFRTCS